jgi:crossover junction endodeoxyribonuclease RusA
MIIKLDFPAPELFPNRSKGTHWTKTSGLRKSARDDAYVLTKASGAFKDRPGYIPLYLLFLTPDKRHRDSDNMLAASKSALDGVAQALGIDDSRFKPVVVDWELGPKGGALIVGVGVSIVSSMEIS